MIGVVKKWIRKFTSFEAEAAADREFWRGVAPDDRVKAVEEMRLQQVGDDRELLEGLRRTVRVLKR